MPALLCPPMVGLLGILAYVIKREELHDAMKQKQPDIKLAFYDYKTAKKDIASLLRKRGATEIFLFFTLEF